MSAAFFCHQFSSLFSIILLLYQYYTLKSQLSTWLLGNAHTFMISYLNWLSILAIREGIFLISFLSPRQLFKTFSTLLKLPNLPHFSSLALSMCLCLLLDGENRNHKKGNCPAPCHLTHRFPLQVPFSPCHLSYTRGVSPPGETHLCALKLCVLPPLHSSGSLLLHYPHHLMSSLSPFPPCSWQLAHKLALVSAVSAHKTNKSKKKPPPKLLLHPLSAIILAPFSSQPNFSEWLHLMPSFLHVFSKVFRNCFAMNAVDPFCSCLFSLFSWPHWSCPYA